MDASNSTPGVPAQGANYPGAVTLLGPQRLRTTLGKALEERGIDGDVATITAGWQDREPSVDELNVQIPGESIHLKLYARSERLMEQNPDLLEANRAWNDQLRHAQRLYRVRLGRAIDAARDLLHRRGTSSMLRDAQEDAIDAIRTLDRQHLERKSGLLASRNELYEGHDAVAEERAAVKKLVDRAQAVAITGGHVAVIMNRLHLFDAPALFVGLPLFAWSAGAMALSERIVLFHDNPPQGEGNAEVLEAGLGITPGIVTLPHAHRRLRLNDRERVALFARRFAPAACVAMHDGSRLDWEPETGWVSFHGTLRLSMAGRVRRLASGLVPEDDDGGASDVPNHVLTMTTPSAPSSTPSPPTADEDDA